MGNKPHFTSTDLVKWVEHKGSGPGGYTGIVVHHENKYYRFYTGGGQTIRVVVGDNPWDFDPAKSQLAAEADNKVYKKGWFRDAYVFYKEDEKLWWMLVEARSQGVCIALFKSKDLLEWKQCEPIFRDKNRKYGSCPQIFKQGDLWYLAIQDYGNHYYTAKNPYGPWKYRGEYLSVIVEAASRFATDGKRQLTWGWLCKGLVYPKKKIGGYGGPLCVGREMVFTKDGAMGVRPLPELLSAIRKSENKANLFSCARKASGQWNIQAAKQTLQCAGESGGTVIFDLPEKNPHYYFEAELEFDSPGASANIILRSSDTADRGYGFALRPSDKKIEIRGLSYRSDGYIINDKKHAFPGKNNVTVQVFICDNHMEAFVDGLECVSAHVVDRSGHKVAIEIKGGSATIKKPLLRYFKCKEDRATGGSGRAEDTDKTLVSWVIPANLTQRGGSVLTIQSGIRFDAIVLGEKMPRRWMAGSSYFRRTQANQDGYPAETADNKTMVQIAIVYDGGEIRIYRNARPYAAYRARNIDLLGIDNHIAAFGVRLVGARGITSFAGAIEDARIYARALTQTQIAALKPNAKSEIDPLAWWDFQGNKVIDRTGRFTHSTMTAGAKLAGGRLVLDGKGYAVAARSEAQVKAATRYPRAKPPKDDVYSRAAPGTCKVPPELKDFRLLSSTPIKLANAKAVGHDPRKWQSDPSRVIFHGGKYHFWMIDGFNWGIRNIPKNGKSWILYSNSKDGKNWKAVDYVPLGPKGSCYDLGIEQANVLYHKGRFYLFSLGLTTNIKRYGVREAGIFCLTADKPEGPWRQVGDVLVAPSRDGISFDTDMVVNPRHVFFKGKWFMYYKGSRKGEPTDNGVAIADSLTGPYRKYEGNPLLYGHGHFAWRYKHGIIMVNFDARWEKNYVRILWTEDGLHFVPLVETKGTFLFGSLYCPYDPLCGKPVTDKPTTRYWGLQSVYNRGRTGWDVERIEWEFGPAPTE